MSSAADTNSLDVPPRCGDCGYELTGLPASGKCPECGGEYSPDTLVLFGWAGGGPSATLTTASPRRFRFLLAWEFAVLTVLCLLAVFSYLVFSSPEKFVIPILLIAPWFIGFRSMLSQRMNLARNLPAPMQVRLSQHGFGERMGIGRVRVNPWSALRAVRVNEVRPGEVRIRITIGFRLFHLFLKPLPVDIIIQSHLSPERWHEVIEEIRRRGAQ